VLGCAFEVSADLSEEIGDNSPAYRQGVRVMLKAHKIQYAFLNDQNALLSHGVQKSPAASLID
jgi:hypothetical protein